MHFGRAVQDPADTPETAVVTKGECVAGIAEPVEFSAVGATSATARIRASDRVL